MRLAPVDDVRVAHPAVDRATHASSLGRIPPLTCRACGARTSSAVACEMRLPASAGSASQPSTSVRKTTLNAPSAAATAPAAASAFTL